MPGVRTHRYNAGAVNVNRSFLFVPADSERKLEKAKATVADALILDLEDAVADASKAAARERLQALSLPSSVPELWVRINPLDSDHCRLDLDALAANPPAGVFLPKANGADDLRALDTMLTAMEQAAGVSVGSTRVIPLVTERASALFRIHEYAGASRRLAALTWGAEDLAAALGAETNRDESGDWLAPYQLARSLCLVGAAAAGLPAIETVFTDVRDVDAAGRFARAARRDGFSGMLAIHPAQLEPIHAAFTPDAAALERAAKIVALFADNPGAGVLELDGKMIDRPHLVQAERLLRIAEKSGSG